MAAECTAGRRPDRRSRAISAAVSSWRAGSRRSRPAPAASPRTGSRLRRRPARNIARATGTAPLPRIDGIQSDVSTAAGETSVARTPLPASSARRLHAVRAHRNFDAHMRHVAGKRPRDRRSIPGDDVPASALAHCREERVHQREWDGQVERDQGAECGGRRLIHGARRKHARVVHQNIRRAAQRTLHPTMASATPADPGDRTGW